MKYTPDVSSQDGRELQIHVGRTKTRRAPGPPACHCIARRAGRSQLVPQRQADLKRTRGAEPLPQGTLPSHVQGSPCRAKMRRQHPPDSMSFAGQLTFSLSSESLSGLTPSQGLSGRSSFHAGPRTRCVRWPMQTRRGSSTVCLPCVVCIGTALVLFRLKHCRSTWGFG